MLCWVGGLCRTIDPWSKSQEVFMQISSRRLWIAAVGSLLFGTGAYPSVAAGDGQTPLPISPGARQTIARTDTTCPTFSWSSVAGATEIEVLVVSLAEGKTPESSGQDPTEAVLRHRIPGGASSWTPPGRRCLAAGDFAWLIRSTGDGEQVSEWSPPNLFSVEAPSPTEDLGQLLDELRVLVENARADPEISSLLAHLFHPESAGLTSSPMTVLPTGELDSEASSIVPAPAVPFTAPETAAIVARLDSGVGTLKAAVDGRIEGDTSGPNQYGVYGYTVTSLGAGVYGNAEFAPGVRGISANGYGVAGLSQATTGDRSGVHGEGKSAAGYGGFFFNGAGGSALFARGYGKARNRAVLRVENLQSNQGMATYMTNSSNYATAHFANGGSGEVLFLQNGSGDFIKAVNSSETDAQFRVLSSGEVRSDVGFFTPAADFAEMLPAVGGLEPGDLLIIGRGGRLEKSRRPLESRVAGVYSTQPGFTGGYPVAGPPAGHVPLAMVGVVPVKATAEGGEIRAGDLLVSSGTPGHVMRGRRVKRDGVVVGKALESLKSGRGKIRMLVVLQ